MAFADNGDEKISKPFLREAFFYGYPFIFSAILSMLLTSGDRYIIQYFKDAAAVGVYSVGYAIPTMIQSLIVAPLNIAIVPILMEVWSEKGEQETKNFLSNLLKYYLMIAIPIIFGIIVLAKDVVVVFATEKFVDAATVVPYVIVAIIIYGVYFITCAGLNIHKKTQVIAQYLLIAVIVNVVLNFLLIPYYGIVGAAIATLIAYVIFFVAATRKSFQYLSFSINFISIFKFIVLSVIMYFCLLYIPLQISLITLIVKIFAGALIYISLLILIDKESRELFRP